MQTTPGIPASSPDLWLVSGSTTLTTFFPDLDKGFKRGETTERELHGLLERRLQAIVGRAMSDLGVHDHSLVDDLVQELILRIATMNAAERFDPALASPMTFLHGIARTLVREQCHRRERPGTIPGDAIDGMGKGSGELDRAVGEEIRQELRHWLDQLSPGELRAIVHTYGPILDYSPPVGPRRRLRNPDALPRAVEILRELGAQQSGQ